MHLTLTPRFNFIYIGLSVGVVVLAVILTSWQEALAPIGITLPLGILAGILRARAIDARPADFVRSQTAMDVRRALVASLPGTVSIVLLRVSVIAVLLWAIHPSRAHRVLACLIGFATFLAARGLLALPAMLRLSR